MSQERPPDEREPRPPDGEPDESVGPARPLRPEGLQSEPVQPAPTPTSPGEYVGRAQPIDPARRQAPAPSDQGSEAPSEEPPSSPGTIGDDEQTAITPPQRPPATRAAGARRTRAASARGALDRVRRADFPVVLRGYDRAAVDAYVAEVAQLVAELEATQSPETVVQRALDEVGDETSAILKRAHEAGEEIASRSRAQAESRLQRAEREAELTRKEAEDQVRRLEDDIQNVWQERQRLLEDIRTLADDVLALADDAGERMPAPGERDGERAAASGSVADEPRADLEPLGPLPSADEGDVEEVDEGEVPAGPASLGLAPEPVAGNGSSDVEGPEDVTAEQRLDDEDTDERPPRGPGA